MTKSDCGQHESSQLSGKSKCSFDFQVLGSPIPFLKGSEISLGLSPSQLRGKQMTGAGLHPACQIQGVPLIPTTPMYSCLKLLCHACDEVGVRAGGGKDVLKSHACLLSRYSRDRNLNLNTKGEDVLSML